MSENSSAKKSLLDRILDAIERAGNKLPDPITMFLGLAIIVTIISAICSAAGVSAVNPADGSTIEVLSESHAFFINNTADCSAFQ